MQSFTISMNPPKVGKFGAYIIDPLFSTFFPEARISAVEDLGYSTIWLAGSPPADLHNAEKTLEATKSVTVATSILNIWSAPVDEVAESYHRLDKRFPGRLVLGVGIGHKEVNAGSYEKPYDALTSYVDRLLAKQVPHDRIILAALRKRVLTLAGTRTLGAVPYFVTTEHTKKARRLIGEKRLVAPVQPAVLSADPVSARTVAADWAKDYLNLQNYVNNLRETGFPDLAVGADPSEALIDNLAAYGSAEDILARAELHIAAGADHVSFLPLPIAADPLPVLTAIANEFSVGAPGK